MRRAGRGGLAEGAGEYPRLPADVDQHLRIARHQPRLTFQRLGQRHPQSKVIRQGQDLAAVLAAALARKRLQGRCQRHAVVGGDREDPEQGILMSRAPPRDDHRQADRRPPGQKKDPGHHQQARDHHRPAEQRDVDDRVHQVMEP